MKLTVIFLLWIISSLAFAKSSVVELKDQILIPLKSCPERVWPAYSPLKERFYSGKEIEIRSYPNGQVRYFIDDKEVEIKQAIENAA